MGWVQSPSSSLEWLLSPQDEQDQLPLCSAPPRLDPQSPLGSTSELSLIPSGISPPRSLFSWGFVQSGAPGPEHPQGFSSPSRGLGADPALHPIPALKSPFSTSEFLSPLVFSVDKVSRKEQFLPNPALSRGGGSS